MNLTPTHGQFIQIYSFDLIPIIAGTYDVTVNGSAYTVGPQGLTISGLAPYIGTITWDNDRVVGIGNIIGVVPEPATWATMLLGFFGLGASLRASRRSTRRVAGGH